MPYDAQHQASARLLGDERMARLDQPARIWAVGSLYGHYGALCQLHEALASRLMPQDRLVYLGNYLGAHSLWTGEGRALLDELIAFRNAVIAIPGFLASDVVFLRGQREDLLLQLLRLPFQRQPRLWLEGALRHGLESYLAAYSLQESLAARLEGGLIALNHWANAARAQIAAHAGHGPFFDHLNSCALTAYAPPRPQIMFTPCGIDAHHPPHLQYEQLVWPDSDVAALTAWMGCARLVRGQALAPAAFNAMAFSLNLDGGDGMDGKIRAACLDPQGLVLETLFF